MYHFVEHSKTDNGEAVSILPQDGRCDVDVAMLEKLLRKGYTAMATVLQQDERVIQGIRMCLTCSTNIGCYECISWGNCEHNEQWYCGDCAESDSSFICRSCDDYVCPDSVEDHENRFHSCEECGIIECDDCTSLLYYCYMCIRWKCTSCIKQDGEKWKYYSEDHMACFAASVAKVPTYLVKRTEILILHFFLMYLSMFNRIFIIRYTVFIVIVIIDNGSAPNRILASPASPSTTP